MIAIPFHSLDGNDLCRVAIEPIPRPVFIKDGAFEQFRVATGNSFGWVREATKRFLPLRSNLWRTGLEHRQRNTEHGLRP